MDSNWTIEIMRQMINDQVEESLTLDYKSAEALGKSDSKKTEISKDVSSFANSDGGVIIYGVSEHQEKDTKHLPEEIKPVKRKDHSKEWLEQVVANIRPRIQNLSIYPLSLDDSGDDVVYVVEIPASNTAHQAIDKRYYRRYNFESVPMDDYEIRLVMNRTRAPRLAITDFVLHLDANETQIQVARNSRLDSMLVTMRFNSVVENMSLYWAEDIIGGIIGWAFGERANIGTYIQSSISIVEPEINAAFSTPILNLCKKSITKKPVDLAPPFEPRHLNEIDFSFPIRIGNKFNFGEWYGVIYLVSKNSPPTLYQVWIRIDQDFLGLANGRGKLVMSNHRQFRLELLTNEQAIV